MERSGYGLRISNVFFSLQIFFILIIPSLSARSTNAETDKLSLLEIKAKINPLRSWNESVHFCSWPGVTCSRRHRPRVTQLVLSSRQLSPQVRNLSFRRKLDLENNSLSLSIPPEIGRLFRLQALYLNFNNFSGEIPANITRCSRLWFIDLSVNNLTGRIPEDIGSLSQLRSLWLDRNNLVGEIPASIGNLSWLLDLWLPSNELKGNIPYSLGQLRNLKQFIMIQNNLIGICSEQNNLEGSLPPDLGHTLPNLKDFYLDQNRFSGSIPATLANASNLVIFQIAVNNFTGKVPNLVRFSNLEELTVFSNKLGFGSDGDLDFIRYLFNCTNLHWLILSDNNFGGTIPEAISNTTSLTRLTLRKNLLIGNIPIGIGNLVDLEVLSLEDNQMDGQIPTTIGRLTKMKILSFENNKLSGTIPSTLGNLTLLYSLSLARNTLQGNIPTSLGDCINLQNLSLAQDNLSGAIPVQLVSFSSMSIALSLSRNRLNGLIPLEVGKLVSLGDLDISENMLSVEIPKTLGSCISLEYLYLGGNLLEGSIPEELESLRGVQVIDLSRNNLSGKIPEYSDDLFQALDYLNLSFNDFEGQVPKQGIFQNSSKFSVKGNRRLCGGLPELKLPLCKSNVHDNRKLSRKIKLVIIFACVTVGMITFLLLGILACSKRRTKAILEPSIGNSLPGVSYGDLYKATNGFASENLIGFGSFGSIYKGKLTREDAFVAVKVLNLQVSRAFKSFIAECESLRSIKHRNLVQILTVCSSIDFQGNDFKALVYEFMENGNLDKWLHFSQTGINTSQEQSQSEGHALSLIQRVNIAVDVANGLDYLHNHCPEPIVHCDIKPSNILLDGDMVACIGDFGLAKLLISTSSNQSSSIGVRGTVGYVAPEYAMGNEVSTLGDIYSFGILLLEMFTGKRPTDSIFKDDFNLNNFVSAALPDPMNQVLDSSLLEEVSQSSTNAIPGHDPDQEQTVRNSLVSIFEIGVACSSAFPGERRNIADVAAKLRQIKDSLVALRMPQSRAQ